MFGSEFVVLGKDMVGEVVGLGGAIKEVVEVRPDKVYQEIFSSLAAAKAYGKWANQGTFISSMVALPQHL